MRIAHVGFFGKNASNGVMQCIYHMAKIQNELGHEVYVYEFSSNSTICYREEENIKIISFPHPKLHGFVINDDVKTYLRENKDAIDLFHLHSVYMPINIAVSNCLSVPYVVTPHGAYAPRNRNKTYVSRIKKGVFDFLFEKKYLKRAKGIHVLTEFERGVIEKSFGITKGVFVCPNGIESQINILRKNKSYYKITFLGRLDISQKGLDILCKGVKEYYDRHGISNKFKISLVGPNDNNIHETLNAMINRMNIRDYIEVFGPVYEEQKQELLSNSDIFIHTSRWEGMPISVLEALSYSIPVIVSEETNISDYVKNYNAGWVIEDLTPKSIADVLEVIDNFDINLISKNAYVLAKEEFSWVKNVKNLVKQYENILNNEVIKDKLR